MSTFKGFIQSFIAREIADAPFPVATAGYGLLALRRYCTGGQILNKVQPAPGQVLRSGQLLDELENDQAPRTRTANASALHNRGRHSDFRELAGLHGPPQFAGSEPVLFPSPPV